MSRALEKARDLRRNNTEAEAKLWQCLKAKRLGVKFRRQVPIGPYIADFICHELSLIVEVDGGHHSENAKDEVRTKFLNNEGFEVLQFWNNDVIDNLEGVVSTLTLALSQRERGLETFASQKKNDQP